MQCMPHKKTSFSTHDDRQPAKVNEPQDALLLMHRRAEDLARDRTARLLPSLQTLSPEVMQQLFHEPQVHQVELELQNDELRRVQHELEAARARYFDLYDRAPIGYLTVGENGLILEANQSAASLLGVSRVLTAALR